MKLTCFAGSAVACALVFAASPASAAIALGSTPYTQNFDTLAASGTSSTLPAGWEIAEGGSNANATYVASAGTGGSGFAGNTYSFGAAGSSDRALGSVASGSLTSSYGATFVNDTGATITGITLSYFGEQWRRGNGTPFPADLLTFEYSLNATSITNGTWTAFDTLDFASVYTGALTNAGIDGNTYRALISDTIGSLSIADGGTFAIRWSDTNSPGNDDGLAIDDVTLSAITATSDVPEPATWGMMVLGFGALGAAMRRRRPTQAVAF